MSRTNLVTEGGRAQLVCVRDRVRPHFLREASLNGNEWIRQIHRWLSLAFTVGVIINIIALRQAEQALWVGLTALIPLIFLLFTGLYLFVLPYAGKWRGARRTA